MSQKCVHKGCGKMYTDAEEPCVYHPGPPVFHEGQKGWKCCKPRYLTFDEFLTIPPCTTGKHSSINDDTPEPQPAPPAEDPLPPAPTPKPVAVNNNHNDVAQSTRAPPPQAQTSPNLVVPESDSDDPNQEVPPNVTCRRRGCNTSSSAEAITSREGEECVHHPGQALFHEGSKGWTCCKRRVLEFDEFMKIQGCKKKQRHLFLGRRRNDEVEEMITSIRHDYYQTPTTVIASLFLKKIDKSIAHVIFSSPMLIELDLPTTDKKRYKTNLPLAGSIDTTKSQFKIMGTKLELILVKGDGLTWPTLRSDEQKSAEIVQVGRAGRA